MRTLLLVLALHGAAAKSSYAELLEEDQQGLTTLEKNARQFLRQVELRAQRALTREEIRTAYSSRVVTLRELENADPQKQITVIREWVKNVGPIMREADHDSHAMTDTHGPLHIVMQSASKLLGYDYTAEEHPYRMAKKLVPEMRRFTEAIIGYHRSREGLRKDEL